VQGARVTAQPARQGRHNT